MKVLKFGGSSVGTPERIKNVIKIISSSLEENKNIAVVFSAFQGVTDELIKIADSAAAGSADCKKLLVKLELQHLSVVKELISVKKQSGVLASVKLSFNQLDDILQGVFLIRELSLKTLDFILSFGERISAFIISEALLDRKIKAEYLDSRKLIITDNHFGSAKVDFTITNKNIKKYFSGHPDLQIITGFIGSTKNDETTTLGRGGSDYTVSIFGAALNAKEIQIWTDVDGVMTANPQKVKNAFSIPNLSYEEAMELSHFGAKVIHPPTMQPALNKKIPIRIKNTFNPSFEGTVVSSKANGNHFSVKGFSSIDNISLLRVHGSGMVGVSGIAERIFKALAKVNVNVILITQASSEHSLCLAVLPQAAELARRSIENELQFEILKNIINPVEIENNLSIVAVVGEQMRKTPGIAGKIFQALGRNGINVSAIAQGSSELNISTVIFKDHESKALNALHDSLFLSKEKSVNLFLAGTGLIGGTLLNQIENQADYLSKEFALEIKIIGLSNSRKMILNPGGINISNWKNELDSGVKANLDLFVAEMKKLNLPNSVFVDCTSSDKVVSKYKEILKLNISIVTPNKKANSGTFLFYQELKQLALKHNVKFLYETNVGAGLPIIGTLKDLVSSGDKILKIEGVLSGTLSFIFNSLSSKKSFSEVVKEAKEKGYTEPDPREDLKGMDAARKLLILAREIGLNLELEDLKVQKITPLELEKTKSVEEFLTKLKKYDTEFENLRRNAEKKGKVLRYIAVLENNCGSVSLQEVGKDHPFYSLSGGDNIVAFTTKYSHETPIVVKGLGAGANVTASGVFADIIRTSHYLT